MLVSLVGSSSAAPLFGPGADRAEVTGVDASLIRWMLSLTPTERLAALQDFADQIVEIRNAGRPLR